MNCLGPKPQQLHHCTICTSGDICWRVGRFTHNLLWSACQLVHTGDDSVSSKIPTRLDAEKLDEAIIALPRELLGLSHSEEILDLTWDHSLCCAVLQPVYTGAWNGSRSVLIPM